MKRHFHAPDIHRGTLLRILPSRGNDSYTLNEVARALAVVRRVRGAYEYMAAANSGAMMRTISSLGSSIVFAALEPESKLLSPGAACL